MNAIVRMFAAGLAGLTAATFSHAQQTNCIIEVPLAASGYFDVFGDRDAREFIGMAGREQWPDRGPARSFLAFSLPNFPGSVIGAAIVADTYCISPDNSETLLLWSVESPVPVLKRGGFGRPEVYADLGDGLLYGSATFGSGFEYGKSVPLGSAALDAIGAARGEEFAIGGAIEDVAVPENYYKYILLPARETGTRLQLELSVPVSPTIYGDLIASPFLTNHVTVRLAACGAEPLAYHWQVNGTVASVTSGGELILHDVPPAGVLVSVVVSNAFGVATSSQAIVRAPPASIDWPNTNMVLRTGSSVELAPSVVSPAFPFTYAWRKNGQPLSVFNSSLLFASLQPSNSGDYVLVVSNRLGAVTSAVCRLEVTDVAPRFWQRPRDRFVPNGASLVWNAFASAGPAASHRWFHNGTAVPGQAGPTLVFSGVAASDAGSYYVVASNRAGVATSQVATLTITADPARFLTHPKSQIAYPGNNLVLSSSADGNPFPAFQWFFNGQPLPGATLPYLDVFNVSSNHAGQYHCVASNVSGVATSQVATVDVLYVPPQIDGPADLTVQAGSTAYLTLFASNPPVNVQWRFNGLPIPDSNFGDPRIHYALVINAETNHAGSYWAIVSNAFGVVTSRTAMLTIATTPPELVIQPTNQNVIEGSRVQIVFAAFGAPPPDVYLLRDGIDTGVRPRSSFFRIDEALFSDAGEYVIVASNRVGIASTQPFRIDVRRAGPFDRWTRRNPIPQARDLFDIAFGQDRFVAVGRDGAIITSIDGTNWQDRTFRTTDELRTVAFGNGRFVALGEFGMALTSTDGDNWQPSFVRPVLEFMAVTFANQQFVAVGTLIGATDKSAVFVSSNGKDWAETGGAPQTYRPRGIAYGNGAYVVIDDWTSFRSADLNAWIAGPTNAFSFQPESLRFLEGKFIVVGGGGAIVTSPDGIAWTQQSTTASSRFHDVAHGTAGLRAVGARGQIYRSTDAVAWSAVQSGTQDRMEGIAFGNGVYVAVGERGMIVTSPDGEHWGPQLRGSSRDLDGLAVGDGMLVAVGKNNTILTSPNGRNWTLQSPPALNTNLPIDWHGVAFGDGRWVVVGDSTNILTSTNAIDWEARAHPATSLYLKSVIHAAGTWVAVGVDGVILTSTDTINWTQQISTVLYDLNEVAYGNGQFVVVGDSPVRNSTVLISTNGIFWRNRTFNTGKNARGVAFGNGLFVAALNDGIILYSSNPDIGWSYAETGVFGDGENLRGLTYSNGWWVCVGNNGRILVSTNAMTWKSRVTRQEENFHAVRYIDGTFVAVGNEGLIVQTAPLVSSLTAARAADSLRLNFSSPWERTFKVEQSDDFNWEFLQTITNASGTIDFTVPIPAGDGARFYRVVP